MLQFEIIDRNLQPFFSPSAIWDGIKVVKERRGVDDRHNEEADQTERQQNLHR